MAIDHRILQQIGVRDNAPALNMFQNALNQAQNRRTQAAQAERQAALAPFQQQIIEQQAEEGKRNTQQARRGQILQSMNDFAVGNASVIQRAQQTGDPSQLRSSFVQHRRRLIDQGLPTETTDEAIGLIDTGKTGEVISGLGDAVNLFNQQAGRGKAPTTPAAVLETQWFNEQAPDVQATHLKLQRGEKPTFDEQLAHAKELAKIDIKTAETKKKGALLADRSAKLKAEFGDRARLAARSTRKVKEAQKLAENATQGLTGVAKTKFSAIFPGIDAGDEGALSAVYKSMALDELQKFKGPTTDFEFRVTEDIAGALGDGASANKARLASLERANWFMSRESEQFNKHVKAGHDPETFNFNFSEMVTPKKGGNSYSLQDLQDTAVANHMSIEDVIKRLSK